MDDWHLEEVNIHEVDIVETHGDDIEPAYGDGEGKFLWLGIGAFAAYILLTRKRPTPAEMRAQALKENIY